MNAPVTIWGNSMNPAIIVMTILGCSDSGSACDYVRTVEARYASVAECQARVEPELLKSGSANYPSVIAVCEEENRIATAPARNANDLVAGDPAAGPTVIMSEFDEPAHQGPVRRTIEKAREVIAGIGRGVGNAWRKWTGKERRDADPLPLSQFVAADS